MFRSKKPFAAIDPGASGNPEARTAPNCVRVPHDIREAPSYWELSRQPLHSLVFLSPLIIGLEVLRWIRNGSNLNPATIGVESCLNAWLESLGIHAPGLLPFTSLALLLAWHLYGRFATEFRPVILSGMAAESLMYASLLVVIGQLQDFLFQNIIYRSSLSIGSSTSVDFPGRIVTFVGAGLYEEVIFRLCLLPLIWKALKILTVPHRIAAGFAVVFTSIAFAAAHQLTADADPIASLSLSFRIVAGLFLSLLFLRRGFGVTAGCHAAYDVLVEVIMQSRN